MNIQPDNKEVEDVLGEAVLGLLERNQPVNLSNLRDQLLVLSSSPCESGKQHACTKLVRELAETTFIYPDLRTSGLKVLNDGTY